MSRAAITAAERTMKETAPMVRLSRLATHLCELQSSQKNFRNRNAAASRRRFSIQEYEGAYMLKTKHSSTSYLEDRINYARAASEKGTTSEGCLMLRRHVYCPSSCHVCCTSACHVLSRIVTRLAEEPVCHSPSGTENQEYIRKIREEKEG
ncbi:hypothetical protein HW555_007602 [Spodoptera exigua]|uniref:Uncharacterized protein n=1 Tax=Spodoptera exigua TaxID=7107 RepID=A0A835GCP4_SPOEX|nr:hypothetical protein HW555_007602 [Spodoptera exigua]